MTRLRADQLPLAVRRKAGIAPKPKRSRAGTADGALCAGRCATCGQQFTRYTQFHRHSRPGHRRWQIDLSDTPPTANGKLD